MNWSILFLIAAGIVLALGALFLEFHSHPDSQDPDVERLAVRIMALPEVNRMELRAIVENMIESDRELGPASPGGPQ